MIRLASCKSVPLALETANCNVQAIRWAPRKPRKPLWYPTARSKLFKVAPRIQIPDDEREEIKRLYNNYRTQVKSVRNYLATKYSIENLEQFDFEQHQKAIDEDFKRCNKVNDQWNEEIRLVREVRVNLEFQKSLEEAKQIQENKLQIQASRLEEAEKLVRKEKEASKHFITPDKLEAAIEYAVNNPVDYNFALEMDGNKIRGRETKPLKLEKEKISQIQ